jgi:serine protease Do
MTDNNNKSYGNEDYNEYNGGTSNSEEYSEYNGGTSNSEEFSGYESTDYKTESAEPSPAQESTYESSYEWNGATETNGEYRHSYVNGNNSDAPHNPNNYDQAYSTPNDSYQAGYGYSQTAGVNNYGGYAQTNSYASENYQGYPQTPVTQAKRKKEKKESKPASKKFVAAVVAVAMVFSAAVGVGGGIIAGSMMNSANTTTSSDGSLKINHVSSDNSKASDASTESGAVTTSSIVKKTADSVVEIATEQTVTGGFARQYVQKGAGSGVIISNEDGIGYIVTNQHVIDGAQNIKVTLRDASTTYDATLVGSDKDADVALLKISADNLSTATFGDSSKLAVGDYVVAIGNPLGTLGGTVTDGIISALAREVTIEDRNMTLLQTNAQISPGNSGGGLFNANGELVGIVNAKDSATEVEGIAFAIPANKVVEVIKDLKEYGYVTGKISLGVEVESISSLDTAFYYGVGETGCYVTSVIANSNAQKAGVQKGDIIKKVNGTEVTSQSDIDKVLKDSKVGDTVTFEIKRNRQSTEISYKLEEYSPSAQPEEKDSDTLREYQDNDDLWNRLFNW